MLAARVLAAAGLPVLTGPLALAPVNRGDRLVLTRQGGGWRLSGKVLRVPWARQAACLVLVVEEGNRPMAVALAPRAAAIKPGANLAGEPRDEVAFDAQLPADAVSPLDGGLDRERLQAFGAALCTIQIAGALERVLEITVAYAGERVQFGRAIGKFQAVQQNLAVLAGQVAAAGAAADIAGEALAGTASVLAIASAKVRAGEAAGHSHLVAIDRHRGGDRTPGPWRHRLHRGIRPPAQHAPALVVARRVRQRGRVGRPHRPARRRPRCRPPVGDDHCDLVVEVRHLTPSAHGSRAVRGGSAGRCRVGLVSPGALSQGRLADVSHCATMAHESERAEASPVSKSSHVSLRIRPDLSERIGTLAATLERSKSWVIEKALEDYLAVQAWQIAEVKEGIAEADAGRLVPHEKVAAWVDSWRRAKRKRRPRV